MCHTHNCLFDLTHIAECDLLAPECKQIPEFAQLLKEVPFTEWDKEVKLKAIGAYAILVIQLQNLTNHDRASLVHNKTT
jgi:hypothetical protein